MTRRYAIDATAGPGDQWPREPWRYDLIEPTGRRALPRLDMPCTDCGDPMWENLYGYAGCVNASCCRFGQMIPGPA